MAPSVLRRLIAPVAAAVLLVGPAARAGTPSAVNSACGSWQRVSSPVAVTGANTDNNLFGVGVLSANAAWAVGYFNPDTTIPNGGSRPQGHDSTLILHWNGSKWAKQKSTNGGGTDTDLQAVAASSSSDVWAVGETGDLYTGSSVSAFAERWDGSAWKTVKTPSPANKQLLGVVAFKPNNAWAVGFVESGGPASTVVEHWDGTKWSVVSTPAPSASSLHDIQGLGPGDIWAVGSASNNPFAMHYDGKSWKVVNAAPGKKSPASLRSVSPVSHTDVLAAGIQGPFFPKGGVTLVEHYNGSTWPLQASQNVTGANTSELHGIVGFTSNVGYAVGDSVAPDFGTNVLLEHQSGTKWVIDAFPQPGKPPNGQLPASSFLSDVDGSAATDVWAVGSATSTNGNKTVILHRC